jgi:hypothetical protein
MPKLHLLTPLPAVSRSFFAHKDPAAMLQVVYHGIEETLDGVPIVICERAYQLFNPGVRGASATFKSAVFKHYPNLEAIETSRVVDYNVATVRAA